MPVAYHVDGSLDGLLTAFDEALQRRECAAVFHGEPAGESLFGSVHVPADPRRAQDLARRLVACAGDAVLTTLLHAFLAEVKGLETDLFAYVRLTLETGRCVDGWHAHPQVRAVLDPVRRVNREVHRCKGLLRFQELSDGTLYAAFAPDHNITMLLGQHFARRLADQRWVIHDCRRQLALFWDGTRLAPVETPRDLENLPRSSRELQLQELWRTYHRRIAITSRRNPSLQRACMPRRYWRYLVEMQPSQ